MSVVYEKSKMLTDAPLHYCPGCTHGIIHKLVAESLQELDDAVGAPGAVVQGHHPQAGGRKPPGAGRWGKSRRRRPGGLRRHGL